MKNTAYLLVALFFFSSLAPLEASLVKETETPSTEVVLKAKTNLRGGGRKNKNGRYRKRRGFLWGLFKGRNQCDCPKH